MLTQLEPCNVWLSHTKAHHPPTYFKKHQAAYYNRLQAVRDQGNWEGWLEFFVRGAQQTSEEAAETARRIVRIREEHRQLIQERLGNSAGKGLSLLESLYRQPVTSIQDAADATKLALPNAGALVGRLVKLGLLREMTGHKRNRRFAYRPYLDLFADGDTQTGQ